MVDDGGDVDDQVPLTRIGVGIQLPIRNIARKNTLAFAYGDIPVATVIGCRLPQPSFTFRWLQAGVTKPLLTRYAGTGSARSPGRRTLGNGEPSCHMTSPRSSL